MRIVPPLGILVMFASSVACGPAPSPVAPTSGDVNTAPPPQAVAAGPALDLSPVAAPADVVGMLRWSNPMATVANLTSCAGLPPQLTEGNTRKAFEAVFEEMFGRAADARQLSSILALDAPAHGLVALDAASKRARPLFAVSVGLVSLERAKGAFETGAPLSEMAPGLWKIGGKERSAPSCAIAASAGSTPARLICGNRDRDVTALGPYLARTLPRQPPEAQDLHAEVHAGPFVERFGSIAKQQLRGLPILAESQLSIGEAKFDRTLKDAAHAVQEEASRLIDDADRIMLDVGVDPSTCLNSALTLQLRSTTSWMGATMVDRAHRAGPPPPIFWQLPKDSDIAFFGRGADPARYEEIFKTLRTLIEGFMGQEKIGSAADRKALAELLTMPLGKDTNSVSASGHLDAATPKKEVKAFSQEMFDGLIGNWLGWNLVGLDEGPAATIKYMKSLVAVFNRPGLIGFVKKQLDPDEAKLIPTVKTVPTPKELGKDSLAVEIKFKDIPSPDDDLDLFDSDRSSKTKPKTLTFTMHLLVTGEDKTTWIAVGSDKKELLKRLSMVKSGTATTTLSSRPGLEPLKTGKFMSGGYVTLSPVTKAISSTIDMVTGIAPVPLPPEVQQAINLLNNLPHKGEGPMFFTSQVNTAPAPRMVLSFNMPKAALEDVGAIALGALKLAAAINP